MEPVPRELVLVPNDGFRRAWTITSPANVVAEQDGRTLTAGVYPERDFHYLVFTVIGVEPAPVVETGTVQVRDDHGREVELTPPRQWVSGAPALLRGDDGRSLLHWLFEIGPVRSDVRSLELSLSGPGGDWIVQIPVLMTETAGIAARRCNVVDIHQRVAIQVTAVAHSPEATVVELETFCTDWRGKEVRGSKWLSDPMRQVGRLPIDESTLRDDRGHIYREQGGKPYGGEWHRRSAWFGGLPADVTSSVLEIPFVELSEPDWDSLTLPVPSESEVEYEWCKARISISTVDERDAALVRIQISPLDSEADRQLLYFGDGVLGRRPSTSNRVTRSSGKPPVLEIWDPSRSASTVTVSHPVLRLGGPWKLEIPRD